MKIIIILLSLFSIKTFAFNYDECGHSLRTAYSGALSIIQFTSSWGPCSAISLNQQEQFDQFFAVSKDQIQNEMAMGHGEYLDALLKLSSCENSIATRTTLQKSYPLVQRLNSRELFNFIDDACDKHRM